MKYFSIKEHVFQSLKTHYICIQFYTLQTHIFGKILIPYLKPLVYQISGCPPFIAPSSGDANVSEYFKSHIFN